jgi:DNA-binding Lrp family transcriptional regulator
MRAGVDRALIAHLLRDQSLSYREIARRANCSDWSVRSIARQLDDDVPEKVAEPAQLSGAEWGAILGISALIVGASCFTTWRTR